MTDAPTPPAATGDDFDYSKTHVIDQRGPIEHELKTWVMLYRAIEDGVKTVEFRKLDRDFRDGDTLRLRETEVGGEPYTGRELCKRIGFVLKGGMFGVPLGYCVMSLLPVFEQPATGSQAQEREALIALIDNAAPTRNDGRDLLSPREVAFIADNLIAAGWTRRPSGTGDADALANIRTLVAEAKTTLGPFSVKSAKKPPEQNANGAIWKLATALTMLDALASRGDAETRDERVTDEPPARTTRPTGAAT